MSPKLVLILLIVVIVAAVVGNSLYYVDERERAIVFKFGEIIRSDDPPGLHWKTPFINNVRFYDARIQTMDAEPELYLTQEKKNLQVDSFVKWRIGDVAKYYVTVGGLASNASSRLAQRVNDSLRREFGKRTVQEVISGDRVKIMELVQRVTNEEAAEIGVNVLDVRLKRVDLVPEISERVYQRMEAERSRVAKELRAQGAEEGEKIRSAADREVSILLANARRDAEKIRGQGDAIATATYADAFGADRDFYRLYRSLNAYKESFGTTGDLIVLDPSSEFFDYFKSARPKNTRPN